MQDLLTETGPSVANGTPTWASERDEEHPWRLVLRPLHYDHIVIQPPVPCSSYGGGGSRAPCRCVTDTARIRFCLVGSGGADGHTPAIQRSALRCHACPLRD